MHNLAERWDTIGQYVCAREVDAALWERVRAAAEAAHAGQMRNNGEPYLLHVLDVADVLVHWQVEPLLVLGGLLHDTVRYGRFRAMREVRGRVQHEELVSLLEVVHRLAQHDSIVSYARDNSRLQKIFDLMVEDVRAVLIRCANRLANLRHLDAFTPEQRHLLLLSSAEVYLPLLERLGMWEVRAEMEDRLFRLREPEGYARLERWKERALARRGDEMEAWRQTVLAALQQHGLDGARVQLVPRTIASIQRQHLSSSYGGTPDLNRLDARHLFTTYVLLDEVSEAYLALGAVHTCGTPALTSFRDYFAQPKANGYAALHTTIVPNDGEPHRLYLRTHRLHGLAFFGILEHAAFDFWRKGTPPAGWSPKEVQILEHFMRSLRQRQRDNLLILTPNGDVREVSEGATVLDFAYEIHTDVGRQSGSAYVNGVEVALHTELHSGDVVEILKDLNRQWPDETWVEWVRTSKALTAIQVQLRQRPETKGRQMVDKELRKRGRKLDDLLARVTVLASEGGSTPEELFVSVAQGKPRPKEVADRLLMPPAERTTFRHVELELTPEAAARFPLWNADMLVPTDCCTPQGNDAIMGYQSERGIELHRADCPALIDPERTIGLRWKTGRVEGRHVSFTLRATYRKGLIHDLTEVIQLANVDIVYMEGKRSKMMDEVTFTLEVANERELGYLINTIRALPNVNGLTVDGQESGAAIEGLKPFLIPSQPIISCFSPGRPVAGEGRFWGRAAEIQWIESWLSGEVAPNLLVRGQRRIGKTSLIQHLGTTRTIREQYRFAFVDLQNVAQSSAPEVLRLLARRIQHALDGERGIVVPSVADFEADALETFQSYLHTLTLAYRNANKRILLALDEFGTLVESVEKGRLHPDIFDMLRSVMQHHSLITFLLCTSDDIAEMLRKDGVLELFTVAQEVPLAPLDREAAQRLIQEPLRGQVYFEPDAIAALMRVTGQHPYYLQIFGSNLVSKLNQEQRSNVYESDIDELVERHTQLHGSEFLHMWDRGNLLQQQVLQALCATPAALPHSPFGAEKVQHILRAAGVSASLDEVSTMLERLVRMESVQRVRQVDGSIAYHVRIELFRRWFATHHPLPRRAVSV